MIIGLEAPCAADFMNPNVQDRFVHVIAHEYVHIQQTGLTDFEPETRMRRCCAFRWGGHRRVHRRTDFRQRRQRRHAAWTRGRKCISSAFAWI